MNENTEDQSVTTPHLLQELEVSRDDDSSRHVFKRGIWLQSKWKCNFSFISKEEGLLLNAKSAII